MVTIAALAASTSLVHAASATPDRPLGLVRSAERAAPRAGTPWAAVAGPARDWRWPVQPHPVGRRFDPPAVRWGAGHRGVDLHAPPGSPIVAPAPGVVVFAGSVAGKGVVSIDHDQGLRSAYEPVRPVVTAGERVHRGQVIGVLLAGSAPAGTPTGGPAGDEAPEVLAPPGRFGAVIGHCAPVTCLHWGVRRDGEYVDPLSLVAPPRVVLLPLGS